MRVVRAVLIFSITLHATGALFAQDLHHFVRPTEKLAVGTFSPEPNLYGTSVESTYVISSLSFQVLQNGSGPTYTTGGGFDRYFTGGTFPYFDAPIVLPTGASIIGIELQACDSHATANISAYIFGGIIFGGVPGVFSLGGVTTSGTPGCGFFRANYASPITVNNAQTIYVVEVNPQAMDGSTSFQAVRLYYKLQVSPPPATPTFNDVPTTHLFYQYIEALAAAGVTSGCGGGNFCPDSAVTRGQLAVFLSKALGLQWP